MRSDAQTVLLTGLFGDGQVDRGRRPRGRARSCRRHLCHTRFDWLTWTNAGGSTRADEHRMMLVNLNAVVNNFLDAGATQFVLARSVRDRHELSSLAAAIGMPLRTVELELPYEEIARRVIADPTDADAQILPARRRGRHSKSDSASPM